jgi:predicted DsbA family dithiol-disulfide isomerase
MLADIFDRDTLVDLAEEIGLDRNAVASMLAGDMFKKEVEADQKALKQMVVLGVPFFLVGDKFSVRGVQAPEVFLATFNQAWNAKQITVPTIQADGAI